MNMRSALGIHAAMKCAFLISSIAYRIAFRHSCSFSESFMVHPVCVIFRHLAHIHPCEPVRGLR
jgi:hypothetical protein